jgi:abortive infection bacteriophage resistance protein
MPTTYQKRWLSVQDQVNLLKQRGLIIPDEARARWLLETVGYYRLSGYWYPFREIVKPASPNQAPERGDQFTSGSSFDNVEALYNFDKSLRLHLLEPIETVETVVRAKLAHYLGKLDTFAHEDAFYFEPWYAAPNKDGEIRHRVWLDRLEAITNKSAEDFVKHFKAKYGMPLPIWVCIELWEFGMLSMFFDGLRQNHKIAVSTQFSVGNGKLFSSWLRSLNFVRNLVAHHSRVWNRVLVNEPAFPPTGQYIDLESMDHVDPSLRGRIFSVLTILLFLLKKVGRTAEAESWRTKCIALIAQLPNAPQVSTKAMGFPPNWTDLRPWSQTP